MGDRKLLPAVMELIAVTVHDKPGADGLYRTRVSDDVIRTWLDAARRPSTGVTHNTSRAERSSSTR